MKIHSHREATSTTMDWCRLCRLSPLCYILSRRVGIIRGALPFRRRCLEWSLLLNIDTAIVCDMPEDGLPGGIVLLKGGLPVGCLLTCGQKFSSTMWRRLVSGVSSAELSCIMSSSNLLSWPPKFPISLFLRHFHYIGKGKRDLLDLEFSREPGIYISVKQGKIGQQA